MMVSTEFAEFVFTLAAAQALDDEGLKRLVQEEAERNAKEYRP